MIKLTGSDLVEHRFRQDHPDQAKCRDARTDFGQPFHRIRVRQVVLPSWTSCAPPFLVVLLLERLAVDADQVKI